MKKIRATVVYVDLAGGFWGLKDAHSKKWMPVNFPEQLKTVGAQVEVVANVLPDTASIQMWGTPIRITSFHTLGVEN